MACLASETRESEHNCKWSDSKNSLSFSINFNLPPNRYSSCLTGEAVAGLHNMHPSSPYLIHINHELYILFTKRHFGTWQYLLLVQRTNTAMDSVSIFSGIIKARPIFFLKKIINRNCWLVMTTLKRPYLENIIKLHFIICPVENFYSNYFVTLLHCVCEVWLEQLK